MQQKRSQRKPQDGHLKISQTRKCKQHIMWMHLAWKDGALAMKILQSQTSQAPQLSDFIMMSTFLAPIA